MFRQLNKNEVRIIAACGCAGGLLRRRGALGPVYTPRNRAEPQFASRAVQALHREGYLQCREGQYMSDLVLSHVGRDAFDRLGMASTTFADAMREFRAANPPPADPHVDVDALIAEGAPA